MKTWQIVLALVAIPVIGFVAEFLRMKRQAKQYNIVDEFLGNFIEWINGSGRGVQQYNWLIAKSDVVQSIIGRFGLMNFRAPYNSYSMKNYPVILNSIPAIQKQFRELYPSQNTLSFYIDAVDGSLRRYLGSQDEQCNENIKNLINPIKLFCAGIACILELPIYFLTECNIISSYRSFRITNGRAFALLSGLATLVAIVGGIMAIVVGWDKFIQIFSGYN